MMMKTRMSGIIIDIDVVVVVVVVILMVIVKVITYWCECSVRIVVMSHIFFRFLLHIYHFTFFLSTSNVNPSLPLHLD